MKELIPPMIVDSWMLELQQYAYWRGFDDAKKMAFQFIGPAPRKDFEPICGPQHDERLRS